MDSNRHLQHLMGEATRLVRNGRLADATRAIQQSLGARAGRFGAAATRAATAAPAIALPAAAGAAPPWRKAHTPADVEDALVNALVNAPPIWNARAQGEKSVFCFSRYTLPRQRVAVRLPGGLP